MNNSLYCQPYDIIFIYKLLKEVEILYMDLVVALMFLKLEITYFMIFFFFKNHLGLVHPAMILCNNRRGIGD